MKIKTICRQYQLKNNCKYGDSCRYQHTTNLQTISTESTDKKNQSIKKKENKECMEEFIYEKYIEILQDKMKKSLCVGTLVCNSIVFLKENDENDISFIWKRVIAPKAESRGWNLSSQTQILGFINSSLLCLQNMEEGGAFVKAFGHKSGLGGKLLEQLLCDEYHVDAGCNIKMPSFQRSLVGLVTMLTMSEVVKAHVYTEESNRIYIFVFRHHEQLFKTYLDCLGTLLSRHSVEDRYLSSKDYLGQYSGARYIPICFTQIFLPIIQLHMILGSGVKDAVYAPSFKHSVDRLTQLIDLWARHRDTMGLALDTTYCENVLKKECGRLHMMIQMVNKSLHLNDKMEMAEQAKNSTMKEQSWDEIWDDSPAVVPPEDAILLDGTRGMRHDNDHYNIEDIKILPTFDELFSEYPPALPGNVVFHPNAHWLPPGPNRWIDTHFRLFREDMCCTLRESVQRLEEYLTWLKKENKALPSKAELVRSSNLDVLLYPVKQIELSVFHTPKTEGGAKTPLLRFGLGIEVKFSQRYEKKAEIKNFWERSSRRLAYRGLVGLIAFGTNLEVLLCTVVHRDSDKLVKIPGSIVIQPCDPSTYAEIYNWEKMIRSGVWVAMAEFNSLMLGAYEPVLRALQSTPPWEKSLVDYLAITEQRRADSVVVAPPLYTSDEAFRFDLSIIPEMNRELFLDPHSNNSMLECTNILCNESTLQRDQADALVKSLSSQVACIQGLPGSGKSFIGSLITQIILNAEVFPILIVCYTNHALDQFLCHLLDAGITDMVRIGRQSKDPRMEKYNLSVKRRHSVQPRNMWELYNSLDEIATSLEKLVSQTDLKNVSWSNLCHFLENNYPLQFESFYDEEYNIFVEGWQIQGKGDKQEDILSYWLAGRDLKFQHARLPVRNNRAIEEILQEENIWALGTHERSVLYEEWIREFRGQLWVKIVQKQCQYNEVFEQIKLCREQSDIHVLRQTKIIGVTTTGAASHQEILSKVGARVVMCEEAGEVLEAQIIPCISASCQQIILIGDHQQLRPHIANYGLSVESKLGKLYRLDISMFERLVADPLSGIPFGKLTRQHRMRPEISQFIRELFYPNVSDSDETKEYPPVKGVDSPVFFVSHNEPEDPTDNNDPNTMRSHSNMYEVRYMIGLLRYLLQQGYNCDDIAILTPYVSQLIKFRVALATEDFLVELNELDAAEVENELDDEEIQQWGRTNASPLLAKKVDLSRSIKVATVDNFQGEEATIILVSLVRGRDSKSHSSRTSGIGFLKTPNRINVLMSRAKHGLYLIGQAELLEKKSSEWQRILKICESQGFLGKGLPIHCENHTNDHREVTTPDEFKTVSPEGGCLKRCGARLPNCGHACPKLCHIDQMTHKSIFCTLPCQRLHNPCEHICPKLCGEKCGKCQVDIGTVKLPCGHSHSNTKCYESYKLENIHCAKKISITIRKCNHKQDVACSLVKAAKQDPLNCEIVCKNLCGATLSCSHSCQNDCRKCTNNALKRLGVEEENFAEAIVLAETDHGRCSKQCGKFLSCCHPCKAACHEHKQNMCPPCTYACEMFNCNHSKCTNLCNEPCSACSEACQWMCKHEGRCNLPCGAPCSRKLCNKRCSKRLDCGHQCPSICGEACPSPKFCQICASEDIKCKVVDMIMFETYGGIDLQEDGPVVVLNCCGSIYTMNSLDGLVDLKQVYNLETGIPIALPDHFMPRPKCPNCRAPIQGIYRYGRFVHRASIDCSEKNFIYHCHKAITLLKERLSKIDVENFSKHTSSIVKLKKDLDILEGTIDRTPCKKVYDACIVMLSNFEVDILTQNRQLLPVPNTKFSFPGEIKLLLVQYWMYAQNEIAAENAARFAKNFFSKIKSPRRYSEAILTLLEVLRAQMLAKAKDDVAVGRKNKRSIEDIRNDGKDLLTELKETSPQAFLDTYNDKIIELDRAFNQELVFYTEITRSELMMVTMAMSSEFVASGHWYRCPNGHPYAIGECGMAMQQTQCPECGAVVGGGNHMSAPGNTHAFDIE